MESYNGAETALALCFGEQFIPPKKASRAGIALADAQLTYHESVRDIGTCLSVQPSKLYGIGFREPVRRATLPPGAGLAHLR